MQKERSPMSKNQPFFLNQETYFFTRVKDTHEEEGKLFITLFARLTVQTASETKSLWVEIDEVAWEQASKKLKAIPNRMHTYSVSADIFRGLLQLSRRCPEELYFLTPLYQTKKCKRLN
jgi:hypothetical protein